MKVVWLLILPSLVLVAWPARAQYVIQVQPNLVQPNVVQPGAQLRVVQLGARLPAVVTQRVIRPQAPMGYLGLFLNATPHPELGEGVTIGDVAAGGPAAAAGVRPGDRLQALNGQAVTNPEDVARTARALPVGKTVNLRIQRNGHILNLPVTVGGFPPVQRLPDPRLPGMLDTGPGPMPAPPRTGHAVYLSGRVLTDDARFPIPGATLSLFDSPDDTPAGAVSTLVNGSYVVKLPSSGRYRLVVTRNDATTERMIDIPEAGQPSLDLTLPLLRSPYGQNAGYLGIYMGMANGGAAQPIPAQPTPGQGVIVQDLVAGDPGAKAGLKPGDLILQFDGTSVDDPVALRGLVLARQIGAKVTLQVRRAGHLLELSATLGRVPPELRADFVSVPRPNGAAPDVPGHLNPQIFYGLPGQGLQPRNLRDDRPLPGPAPYR